MYQGYLEEGDTCENKEIECNGKLEFAEVEGCSCHINSPCSACTSQKLTCPLCGWEQEDE